MRLQLIVSFALVYLIAEISGQNIDLFGRFHGCVRIPCGVNARCLSDRRTCACNSGYNGNPYQGCADVNECKLSRPVCASNADCTNTPGTFSCSCRSGYSGDGFNRCTNINECTNKPCGANAVCADTPGSYTCRCKNGYTGNGYNRCRDINECTNRPCASNAICTNTQGSYTCRCRNGYTGNGYSQCIAIPKPTTTTSSPQVPSSPRTTPTPPEELELCEGKNRTWSECIGSPLQRFTTDTCKPRVQNCTDGIYLGNLFTKNFLAEAAASGTSQPDGSRTGSIGERTTFTANKGSTSNRTACNRVYVRNAEGRIITGRCERPVTAQPNNVRSKRQVVQQQTHRDLLIMLDESFSVGRRRYQKVKRLAAAIVRLLCERIKVHPDYTRVAVTSFNRRVYFNIRLESIRRLRYLDYSSEYLANYIFRYLYFHGGNNARKTCLVKALEHAYNVALDGRFGGRRGDPYVEQDIIIISDGCENCLRPSQRVQQIEALTSFFIDESIHVYVIGIGLSDPCRETLSLLAQGGRCFHFFYLTQWDYDVDDFINQLENPPAGVCLSQFETNLSTCLAPF